MIHLMREEKQHRDCEECIAYYNMLGGEDNRCGLGFRVTEDFEIDEWWRWHGYYRPYHDECEVVPQPQTTDEFLAAAKSLGIDWNEDDVFFADEYMGWW